MGGAKLLKWRLAAEGAKLLKSRAVLILTSPPGCVHTRFCAVCRPAKEPRFTFVRRLRTFPPK